MSRDTVAIMPISATEYYPVEGHFYELEWNGYAGRCTLSPPQPPLLPSLGCSIFVTPFVPRTPPQHTYARQELMGKLASMGVQEIQLHEPALVMWDSSKTLAAMFKKAYFADKVEFSSLLMLFRCCCWCFGVVV